MLWGLRWLSAAAADGLLESYWKEWWFFRFLKPLLRVLFWCENYNYYYCYCNDLVYIEYFESEGIFLSFACEDDSIVSF